MTHDKQCFVCGRFIKPEEPHQRMKINDVLMGCVCNECADYLKAKQANRDGR